jgi:serine-type D-Ala-D-Ala carboxypeptidase/endopeptidase (penicillin-binding protein 4)
VLSSRGAARQRRNEGPRGAWSALANTLATPLGLQSEPVKRLLAITVVLLASLGVAFSEPPGARRRRPRRVPKPPPLVWHIETLAGDVVTSDKGDEPINPASVVKVATTMWAIERLGPDFRFETRIFSRGTLDPKTGVLRGDLVVQGSGDPDFHAENAFLVAQALNRLGVREVRGKLVVNRSFWMGWENGSAGAIADPEQRSLTMASRLRQALDSQRWKATLRRAWRDFAAVRGLPANRPFRVVVTGGVAVDGEQVQGEMLVVHRSQSLATALRRFNCYSNNDIERVGAVIGSPGELAGVVAARCSAPGSSVQLETMSGLGTNRISPHTIVRMLREFRASAERLGVTVADLLPASGCDPGTVTGFFPQLSSGANVGSVIGKTGTLTSTDGGITVLAGFINTTEGEFVFCVAAPGASGRLKVSRQAEERFLLSFLAEHGGARSRSCGPPLPGSDTEAGIILVGGQ